MLNAAEAREISMNYCQKSADHHLCKIEECVKAVAGNGGMATTYANGVSNVTPQVEEIILSVLSEAGYKVAWGSPRAYLTISWREQKEEKTNG